MSLVAVALVAASAAVAVTVGNGRRRCRGPSPSFYDDLGVTFSELAVRGSVDSDLGIG